MKMNKYFSLIIFLISFIVNSEIKACSCDGPTTFMKSIYKSNVIFSGKILQQHKIENKYQHIITEIEVIKWYSNKLKSDTIFFMTGPTSCSDTYHNLALQDSFIFNVQQFIPEKFITDSSYYDSIIKTKEALNVREFINSSNCTINRLKIKGNYVEGSIKKNKFYRNLYIINRIKRLNIKLHNLLRQAHFQTKYKPEKISITKFEKLLKKNDYI